MKNKSNRSLIAVIALLLVLAIAWPAAAAEERQPLELQTYLQSTADWLVRNVAQPTYGSVGGEWSVMGMARSDCKVSADWYDTYYKNLQAAVRADEGILSSRKYTEYSRVILALTALGKDPTDVRGYNLLSWLGDYDMVLAQGINGPIFALLALDSGVYAMPICNQAASQASREKYIDYILQRQNADGGWGMNGSISEADVTGMALQALAGYEHQPAVKKAIERGVECLSARQEEHGSFSGGGPANVESTAQVIMALCELRIDPCGSQFTKDGYSVIDGLLGYYVEGGGFKHNALASKPDIMATEQGFYALVAYQRYLNRQNSFYDMTDVKALTDGERPQSDAGLVSKNPDVKAVQISINDCQFDDIKGLQAQSAIEALAVRGIINGLGNNAFAPQRNMTRAEYATLVVRALGLTPLNAKIFTDVAEDSWYSAYVATAYKYGIVSGTSVTDFTPEATITRQEAAVMIARAANLCGLDSSMNEQEVGDILARFTDYSACADWAKVALAFCYQQEILPGEDDNIMPATAITRGEIAAMVYRLLTEAQLI